VTQVPIVDVGSLLQGPRDRSGVAEGIGRACRELGFFYVVGHGVPEELSARLERLSRTFFAEHEATKMDIRMELGGRAWRGYFPLGGELTSGKPDQKEGLYFGAELSADDPRVLAGLPMHGPNLFPDITGFRETVLEYLDAMTQLGHGLVEGLAMSLGIEASYFATRYTADPFILFRIFNYPPAPASAPPEEGWGVGEHTDYGLLTILRQDGVGGLEVRTPNGWIDAPPVPGSFVCNIGDMLERMTGGLYRSTPHRVRNTTARDRLSFPFFFDPSFDAEIGPIDGIPLARPTGDPGERWDKASPLDFEGTYGAYILGKVAKVFPDLHRDVG